MISTCFCIYLCTVGQIFCSLCATLGNMNDLSGDIDDFYISEALECELDECSKLLPSQACLTVLTQNIRSLNRNFAGFQVLLARLGIDCDILILTECWLSSVSFLPTINGYYSFRTTLNPIQNDGVVVYIKDQLTFSIEEVKLQNCNSLLIKIGNNDTAILAVYRSPSYNNLDPFLTSLDDSLRNLSGFRNIALIGDLNIDINSDNPRATSVPYLALTAYHGLMPAHNFITRDAGGTCIDHVLLRTNISSTTIVLQSTLTDHKSVILCLKQEQVRKHTVSTYTKINEEELRKAISDIDFNPIYKTNDCDLAMSYIIRELRSAIERNSKCVVLSRRKKLIKPWITPGMLRCMRNRDKLHKNSKSLPNNIILKATYIRYRNFCSRILKNLKRNYERELIRNAGKDSKKLWDTIKNITHTAKEVSYPKEILEMSSSPQDSVNYINNYFNNVGKSLAEKITNLHPHIIGNKNYLDTISDSFVLLGTSEEEVTNLISALRSNCSVGWDNVSNRLLKEHKKILVPHLTYVFNMCLEKGVFPKDLKKSQIRPIYKAGARNRIENYRPISILPSLSKILEKIINIRLVDYLEKKHIISDHQFGFRQGKSTDDAVSNLTNFLTTNLDKGNKCVSIFLDLSKAFDTVSIPILLFKLERMGIRGIQLNLLTDYLTNRSQSVKLDTYISADLPVTVGIPQGSILGPTLFLVYINDLLCLKSFHGKIISYADDTALIFVAKTWEETFTLAQSGFNTVNKWLHDNVLTLNIDKTKYIAFSMRNYLQINRELIAHNCLSAESIEPICTCARLERTRVIKYLGVMIDGNLNFKSHIHVLATRIRKLIFIFKTLRHIVTPFILKQIYYALCQSLLTYCISSWGVHQKQR